MLTLKINAQLLHQMLGQLPGKGKRGCKMSKTALTLESDVMMVMMMMRGVYDDDEDDDVGSPGFIQK